MKIVSATGTPLYLMAGGGARATRAYGAVLAEAIQASRIAHPAVAVIGAANDDDPGFFEWTAQFLRDAGAGTVSLAHLTKPHADVHVARALLDKADMVFIAGGDVEEGMRVLTAHQLVPFIHDLYARGIVFCGISAGAIMLAQTWVRWRDPEDDATAELFPCLGLAPLLCDVHAEGDDWEELKTVLRLTGGTQKGYGIHSGAALRVNAASRVETLCGQVTLL